LDNIKSNVTLSVTKDKGYLDYPSYYLLPVKDSTVCS